MPSVAELQDRRSDIAPWLPVPQHPIISLEHLGIVRNIDRGIACFGNEKTLNEFLTSTDKEKSLNFYLNPTDPLRRGIKSGFLSTSNALLKISVPKWTGRKRKRGSNDPFTPAQAPALRDYRVTDVKVMLQSMRDNPAKCKVEPLGLVDETHRFRDLPDFQWSTMTSRTAKDFQEKLLPLTWDKVKHFHIDVDTKGDKPDIDMIPPPVIIRESYPHQYQYTQNTYVRTIHPTNAAPSSVNRSAVPKKRLQMLKYATQTIPTMPSSSLPPESSVPDYATRLIGTVRDLFHKRPIMTRRVLYNSLPADVIYDVPYAVQYVAYQFSSGPWKDAMIRFGVDPREDPECRRYQTIALRGHKNPQLFASALPAEHADEEEGDGNDDDDRLPEDDRDAAAAVAGASTVTTPKGKGTKQQPPVIKLIAGKGARNAAKRREKADALAAKPTTSRWHWRKEIQPLFDPNVTPSSSAKHQQQQQKQGDPRSPEMATAARQQTSHLFPSLTNYAANPNSHIFDGTKIDPTMHTWQVCDITDPQLLFLLRTPPRKTCDISCDGWFLNGAWAKARVVMREKLKVCKLGGVPVPSDYERVLGIPDEVGEWNWEEMMVGGKSGKGAGRRKSGATSHELEMASSIRQLCQREGRVSRGRGVLGEEEDGAGGGLHEGDEDEDGDDGDADGNGNVGDEDGGDDGEGPTWAGDAPNITFPGREEEEEEQEEEEQEEEEAQEEEEGDREAATTAAAAAAGAGAGPADNAADDDNDDEADDDDEIMSVD